MRTLTAEQFKKLYGSEALQKFQPIQQPQEPGYFERVIGGARESLEQRADKVEAIRQRETNPLLKGFQAIGQGAGLAADVLESTVFEAPGVKTALKPVGSAIQWALEPSSNFQQKLQQAYSQATPDVKDTLEAAFDYVRLGTDVAVAGQGARVATEGVAKVGKLARAGRQQIEQGVKTGLQGLPTSVEGKAVSQNIMNRVARLNPTDEVKFTKVAGKSPGQYLTDTGNFGDPQSIIAKETAKFSQSKNMVDDAFSKLPGEYRVDAIDDALNMLAKKGAQVSSPGVKAPFMQRVEQLIAKSKVQGLDMSEINEVKRLLEREVKLGYNKLTAPNTVAKATNIDSAIRKWQFSKAKNLGFKNLDELNKQTQISKFLVDKLGDKIVGQQALNNISLTDWVILSGGDPTAIGGFLTKKFFSSKAVQAKIAKLLGGGKASELITPKTDLIPEYLQQKALPPGNIKPGVYPVEGRSITPAPTTFEKQAPRLGGNISQSISKAKASGQSFDEWVKGQGEQVFHGSPKADLQEIGFGTGVRSNPFMGTTKEVQSPSIFFTKDKSVAETFAKNRVEYLQTKDVGGVPTVYERFINKKGILDLTKPKKIDEIFEKLKISSESELEGLVPNYGLGEDFSEALASGRVEMGDLFKIFDDPKLVKKFKDAGYKGVRLIEKNNLGESIAIFDPKAVKTRSQLKAEWDGAKGEVLGGGVVEIKLSQDAESLLNRWLEKSPSAQGVPKENVLNTAKKIARLGGESEVKQNHIAEAMGIHANQGNKNIGEIVKSQIGEYKRRTLEIISGKRFPPND